CITYITQNLTLFDRSNYLHNTTHILLHFFFLSLLHPPGSTLFPYTTLFRSLRPARLSGESSAAFSFEQYKKNHEWQAALGFLLQDRKSTRLNSSHLVISYAVFCLKKKSTPSSSRLLKSYSVARC